MIPFFAKESLELDLLLLLLFDADLDLDLEELDLRGDRLLFLGLGDLDTDIGERDLDKLEREEMLDFLDTMEDLDELLLLLLDLLLLGLDRGDGDLFLLRCLLSSFPESSLIKLNNMSTSWSLSSAMICHF